MKSNSSPSVSCLSDALVVAAYRFKTDKISEKRHRFLHTLYVGRLFPANTLVTVLHTEIILWSYTVSAVRKSPLFEFLVSRNLHKPNIDLACNLENTIRFFWNVHFLENRSKEKKKVKVSGTSRKEIYNLNVFF